MYERVSIIGQMQVKLVQNLKVNLFTIYTEAIQNAAKMHLDTGKYESYSLPCILGKILIE